MINFLHCKIKPISAHVSAPEINNGTLTSINIIGISCYHKEKVTFWIESSHEEWIYCYIPSHYISLDGKHFASEKNEEPLCKGYTFVVTPPVKKNVMYKKAETLLMLDFINDDEILWLISRNGALEVRTHRRFSEPSPNLKKIRKVWT